MKFRWDGGFIMVSWDKFEEGVEWYTKHMGWKCLDQVITPVGKKAFLKLPHSGVVTLKSFESMLEHFQPGSGKEGNTRLCFEITDLEDTLHYFKEHRIPVSEIVTMPEGQQSFDVFAFDNARLTVVLNPEHDGEYPDSRIIGFGAVNMRLGVTEIKQAIEWYQKNLGFKLVKDLSEQGYAQMQVEDAYYYHTLNKTFLNNIWLEKVLPSAANVKGDPSVRTYFDIRPEYFDKTYQQIIDNGLKPSEVAGNPKTGWGGFHLFDPDGNRINVWSYQLD